jgi:2-hydroxy-6-oxonona-2,4-dienedioate hydrolase
MHQIDLDRYKIEKNKFKTKKVNGYNIIYTESENASLKHVLFIHGIGASLLGWRDIPDALSEQFHTIAVDLIGFGGSDKPKEADYTIKGFSKFILDFIQAIGITNEKICIVGHSLGGYIALQFAIQNKKLVEKLVLIDPSGKLNEPTTLLSSYYKAANESAPPLKYDKLKKVFEDMYALSSSLLPSVVGIFLDTIEKPYALNAFNSAFENSTRKEIESNELKKIDIPCLILWGEYDNLIPGKQYAMKFLNDLSNSKLEVIPDSGHAPFVEKTSLVYTRIQKFLTT